MTLSILRFLVFMKISATQSIDDQVSDHVCEIVRNDETDCITTFNKERMCQNFRRRLRKLVKKGSQNSSQEITISNHGPSMIRPNL